MHELGLGMQTSRIVFVLEVFFSVPLGELLAIRGNTQNEAQRSYPCALLLHVEFHFAVSVFAVCAFCLLNNLRNVGQGNRINTCFSGLCCTLSFLGLGCRAVGEAQIRQKHLQQCWLERSSKEGNG